MSTPKKLEHLIAQMENYLECWKQFNGFVNLARGKKFGVEDENQFLEVKSVIVQELELILASSRLRRRRRRRFMRSLATHRPCAISAKSMKAPCATWKTSGTRSISAGTPSSGN